MTNRKDEQIGPFTVRVRTLKEGPVATAFIAGGPQEFFRGHASEDAALEIARAWAHEEAAKRPVVPRRASQPRKMPEERISIARLKEKFLKHFPLGFEDPRYLSEAEEGERPYKLRAKARLEAVLTPEQALFADATQCESVKAIFGTNMLSVFENARVCEVLSGPAGPQYLRGAAQVVRGETANGFDAITASVSAHGQASWPIATFLPFLWDPDHQIFLKIRATQRVAGWLGHDFCIRYEPQLSSAVHQSLLDFATTVRTSIADMSPRDMIDVQSFIWVVSEYD